MDKQTGLDLISMIRHVLHNMKAPVYDYYEDLYKLAKFHDVLGITYLAIKDQKDISCYKEWKKAYDVTSMRNIYFDVEREAVFNEMKKHGLSYMPLKGVNLLSCYGDYGMRMMSDNDILYGFVEEKENQFYLNNDKEKVAQNIMVEIMKNLGYSIYSLKGKDDVFHKQPFYNFEMHRRLTERGHLHFDYYLNPFEYAYKDESDENLYHLSIEEEYIFILEHAFKHFEVAGVGIRYLIDMYVYLRTYKDKMNFEYIDKQIDKLQMNEFYYKSTKLCMDAFELQMDEEDKDFLDFLLSCGVYGTDKQHMENRLKGKTKLGYLIDRLYPTSGAYQDQYPLFYKYKILFPFLPLYRFVMSMIKSPLKIWKEIKMLIRKK